MYQWFTFAHAFSAHGTANISWSYAPRVGYIYTSQHDTRLWDLGGNAGELEAVLPVTGDNPYYLLVWQTVRLDSIPSPEPAKRVTLSIDWRNAATEYYVVIIAGDKRAAGKDSISLTIESTPLSARPRSI